MKKAEGSQVKVLEERKNPILHRDEMVFEIGHEGRATPSRKEMLESLAGHLKAQKEHIIVDKVFNLAGHGKSRVKVLVYKKPEDIPKGKLEKMQRRMKPKKEAEAKEDKKE
ncbi:MAG: hypothetical protein HY367_01765 [Candidatus Aenigmarchaeota archaeon]|nr:hypothetical protein [Candidatus Aenigmarchaeota archaeon]